MWKTSCGVVARARASSSDELIEPLGTFREAVECGAVHRNFPRDCCHCSELILRIFLDFSRRKRTSAAAHPTSPTLIHIHIYILLYIHTYIIQSWATTEEIDGSCEDGEGRREGEGGGGVRWGAARQVMVVRSNLWQ